MLDFASTSSFIHIQGYIQGKEKQKQKKTSKLLNVLCWKQQVVNIHVCKNERSNS